MSHEAGEKVPILPAVWTWAHRDPFPREGQIERLISAKERHWFPFDQAVVMVLYLIPELQPVSVLS